MKSCKSLLIESYKLGMRGEYLKEASEIHDIEKLEMYNQAWFNGIRGEELSMILSVNKNYMRYFIEGYKIGMRGDVLRGIYCFSTHEKIEEYIELWKKQINDILDNAKEIKMESSHYCILSEMTDITKMKLFISAYKSHIRGNELENLFKKDEEYIRDYIDARDRGLTSIDQIEKFIELEDYMRREIYCTAIIGNVFNEEYIDKIIESEDIEELLSVLESHHKENNK